MEVKGFRRDIMVLHALSELMEKHPDLPRPTVALAPQYKADEMVAVRWYLHAKYDLEVPKWDSLNEEYSEYQARREVARRIDLEQRIAAIIDALGGGVEWVKNDPTTDEYYYRLETVWQGATVEVSTTRDAVCEKVVVLETEHEEEVPDPELHETFLKAVPKVKVMVKDTVTEWQCNTALAEKTAPKHTREVTVV